MADATVKTKDIETVVYNKPSPLGKIPIELANLEITVDDPFPQKGGAAGAGSVWDHLLLRLEAAFTKTTGVGPSCVLDEFDGEKSIAVVQCFGLWSP